MQVVLLFSSCRAASQTESKLLVRNNKEDIKKKVNSALANKSPVGGIVYRYYSFMMGPLKLHNRQQTVHTWLIVPSIVKGIIPCKIR